MLLISSPGKPLRRARRTATISPARKPSATSTPYVGIENAPKWKSLGYTAISPSLPVLKLIGRQVAGRRRLFPGGPQQITHQQHATHGDGAVGHVERRKGPAAPVEFQKIGDGAARDTVKKVAG